MPELPEVETVRRGIESRVVGRKILDVEVGRERSVRRVGKEAVVHGLTGTTMIAARRRGKYILCDLDSGDAVMIHLRMSGRVLVEPTGTQRPAHTHVVLQLAPRDGLHEEMWFVDPRTFGEVVVYDPRLEAEVLPELTKLGPDPISDRFDGGVLAERLAGRRGAIKPLLLNQHVVAGVGNIYADEALFRARLHPLRAAGSVGPREARLTLTEGRYHQVRRMFAVLDATVVALHRDSFGALSLEGLAPGQWRELPHGTFAAG